mmetsp:Transcript_20755/g.45398  ORF Transcript_20755/g.45398 Transcript_20755/m.45398 type:complete len:312 (-) Transcript_20755:691-1626(-)
MHGYLSICSWTLSATHSATQLLPGVLHIYDLVRIRAHQQRHVAGRPVLGALHTRRQRQREQAVIHIPPAILARKVPHVGVHRAQVRITGSRHFFRGTPAKVHSHAASRAQPALRPAAATLTELCGVHRLEPDERHDVIDIVVIRLGQLPGRRVPPRALQHHPAQQAATLQHRAQRESFAQGPAKCIVLHAATFVTAECLERLQQRPPPRHGSERRCACWPRCRVARGTYSANCHRLVGAQAGGLPLHAVRCIEVIIACGAALPPHASRCAAPRLRTQVHGAACHLLACHAVCRQLLRPLCHDVTLKGQAAH